jgi:hypothetical protein
MTNKIIGIAINEYDDPTINNLNNCLNDVNAAIDILTTKYNFTKPILFTKKEQTTHSIIYNNLYNIFTNALDDENILLLFAGHGEYNPIIGASYWLTSDAVKNDASTWFNVYNIITFMKASSARHISIISDSCFSGAIFEVAKRGGGISAIENKRSRYALTSGGKENVSDGNINELSPFANALIKTLKDNTSEELSFTTLSENTIKTFTPYKNQTPQRGELAGDEGGSFIFRLKYTEKNTNDESKNNQYQDIRLALGINPLISIEYDFVIPSFHINENFKADYINGAIQELGYNIIQEVRSFILEDETGFIEQTKEASFFLQVGYNINIFNHKFLSVSIARSDHFGGAHPNNYIYSINFAFKPDRKINFPDLVDYSYFKNFNEFMFKCIEKYGDHEYIDVLKEYTEDINPETLEFSFNDNILTIELLNIMPRYLMAISFIEIPLSDLKLKL